MRPFSVGAWGGVALCGLLLQGSCVRFNTYYNARRAYRDAEQLAGARVSGSTPGTQELAHLDRCLEKCALIIARHSESGLADDALFLMARALTLKGQHSAAADKFAELRRFFPESDLDSPSRFHEAESRSQIGQYDAAEALISEHLARGDHWDQWQERGALLYAEVAGRLHVPLVALARIDTLLSRTDRKTVTCPAQLLRARSLTELGRDEEAVRWFREADRTAPNRSLRFVARLQMGEALARLGRGPDALAAFGRLQQLARADSELAQVGLAVGLSHRGMGDFAAAEEAWRNVVLAYPREDASRQARMELATMLERDRHDLTGSLVEYEELAKQGTPRLLVEEAGRRAKALRDVERLRAALAESGQARPDAFMDLAELYLLRLQLPDSALPLLTQVGALYTDSAWAARALYGAAWVSASRGDSATAESLWHVLVAKHPDSRHARAVRAGRGELPAEAGESSTAGWTYHLGESAWLHAHDAPRALAAFSVVVDSFPDASEAPRALLAMAWVEAEEYHDTLRAREHLRALADRYADTEQGRWAALASGTATVLRHQPYDVPPRLARIDTVTCGEIAPVDSLHRLGSVMVRVLIDSSGAARDVELVKGTGSLLCDDAALGAARAADYVSAQKGSAPVEAWLDLSVPFLPAGRDTTDGPA